MSRSYAHIFKIFYISFSFFLFFLAFNIAQNFVTTVHGNVGFLAIAVLYLFFSFASPFAPAVVNQIGSLKVSLFFASSIYIVWIAVSNLPNNIAFLIISAAEGIAAAILWNAQGRYLSELVHDTGDTTSSEYFSAIFFSMFGVSVVIGNVISTAVFRSGLSLSVLLWIVCIIGSIGVFSFIFLPSSKSVDPIAIIPSPEVLDLKISIEVSAIERILDCWTVGKEMPFLLFAIASFHYGYSTAYIYTKFPLIVSLTDIPNVELSWAIASAIGPVIGGYLFSCHPLLLLGMHSVFLLAPHLYFVSVTNPGSSFLVLVVLACSQGFADSFVNTLLNASLVTFYGHRDARFVGAAFALLRFYSCLGVVLCCVVGNYESFQTMSIVILCLSFPAIFSYITFYQLQK